MRRYRGVDKAPGPSVSPPRQSRFPPGSGSMQFQSSSAKKAGAVSSGENPLMISGSGANSFYMDPRTKQPVMMPTMPQAGRSIQKLRMADLTRSLSPEDDIMLPKIPLTKVDKRIAATLKEVTASPTKDMLESFDEALRVPDLKAINSRVALLKQGLAVPKFPPTKTNNLVGSVKSKTSTGSTSVRKQSSPAGGAEEKNIRVLMDQLKDKYLDDMESQLGLAVERRPRNPMGNPDFAEDQSGGDGPGGYGVPKPSTNATEITTRIDKVVRDWAAESQKMSRSATPNISKQASLLKVSRRAQDMSTSPLPSPNTVKGKTRASDVVPEKNKNLEKISSAFRKTLDPVSKRDVRELINIPEDDHVDKLQEEHDERRRAHESVFKNAVVMDSSSSKSKKDTSRKKKIPEASKKQETPTITESQQKVSYSPSVLEEKQKETRKPFPQAIMAAKDDKDEMYTIIKDHMAYEMASGPPKLSVPKKPSYTKVRQQPSLLRSDAAGKALLKYSDSHKKLQTLVDAFQEKVVTSTPPKRAGPTYTVESTKNDDSLSDTSEIDEDKPEDLHAMDLSILASQTALPSRKHVTIDVTATLSKSMKTIGRASTVAQRLGTLMSRVSLRNEQYDYEKKLEEAQAEETKTMSTGTDPMDHNGNFAPPDPMDLVAEPVKPPSIMAFTKNSGASLNPYENSPSNSIIAGADLLIKPNIAPGVSKLDSHQFGKYVDEMKKVAEKAAESFEKFKETQLADDNELLSSSDGESLHDLVDLSPFQQPQQQRPPQKKVKSGRTTTVKVKNADAGTSPRELELLENLSIKKLDEQEAGFKFVPDMSYTDQLMLQKLRKLKEKEGRGDSMQSQVEQISQAADLGVGDDDNETTHYNPGGEMEMDSLLKLGSPIQIPKDVERPGMGAAVSLNAILRARMSGKGKQDGK